MIYKHLFTNVFTVLDTFDKEVFFYFTSKIRYGKIHIVNIKVLKEGGRSMTWKTINMHLTKGSIFAVYGDSAPFFKR